MFQTLAETLKNSELEQAFSDVVSSHLRVQCTFTRVQALFSKRKSPQTAKKRIRNPFIFKPAESTLPVGQEDQLLGTLQIIGA